MSTKVICLIIILSVLAAETGTCLASTHREQMSHQDQRSDFDELRVSSSRWPIQIVSGAEPSPQRKTLEQVTNHIGKPLVQLPQQQQHQQPQQSNAGQKDRDKLRYLKGASTSLPERFQASANEPKPTGRQQQKLAKSSIRQLTPNGSCRWMSLDEFKNVSLDTNELIIRDAEDQPCYIFSLKAYFLTSDNAYLPLNNLKAHPRGSTVEFSNPSDGASVRLMPLNCSLNAASGATGLFLTRSSDRSFKEDIIIIVDCGYLILGLRGDGSNLTLERLSFYMNTDIASQANDSRSRAGRIKSLKMLPQFRPELLVFSSEGMQRQSNSSSPFLFTMPLISRYICQNRVVLTDKNSTRLVLDRFELKRLSYPSLPLHTESPSFTIWRQDGGIASNQSPSDDAGTVVISKLPESAAARAIHDATNSQRIPVTLARLASVAATDTRCPNPTSPSVPLNSMMEFTQDRVPDPSRLKRSEVGKWDSVPINAAAQIRGIDDNWYTSIIRYLLITISMKFLIERVKC